MTNAISGCYPVHSGGYVVSSVTYTGCGAGYTNWSYPTVTNAGTIYNNVTPIIVNNYQTTKITIPGQNPTDILSIYSDGQIEWYGSLNKCAEQFINVVGYHIDRTAVAEHAMAKSYRKAIERCLRQIKQMSKEEFIIMLEKEVDVRMSKAVLMSLMDEENEPDE